MFPGLRQQLTGIKELNEGGAGTSKSKQEVPKSSDTPKGKQKEEVPNQDGQGKAILDAKLMSIYPNEGAATKEKLKVEKLKIDGRQINSVMFMGDGRHVLTGGYDHKIRCWRVEDGEEVGMPMDAGSWVYNIAVSRDGRWIVSGADRGFVRLFDADSQKMVRELKGHTREVYAVDVSPDGMKIVSGSSDFTARVWSLSTGEELQRLKHDFSVIVAKFSPNGLFFVTATSYHESTRIYQTKDGRLLADFKISVTSHFNESVAWHHDSKHLFVASKDGHIHHLDVSTKKTLSEWRVHWHSDINNPRCVALASGSAYIATSAGRFVSFWDAVTCEQVGPTLEHASHIYSVAISTDHDMATGAGKTITLLDLCDILPPHYYPNAGPKLHRKLADLQKRYKMQSRQLAIVRLTAELNRWKRSVSIKTHELAIVRRELDQLEGVSRELITTRYQVRSSHDDIHETHQQYGDQWRAIRCTVADHLLGLSDTKRFIMVSDAYTTHMLIQNLERLNSLIQLTSLYMAKFVTLNRQFPIAEERSSAGRRASELISQPLVDRLGALLQDSIVASYLPTAFQAYLTTTTFRIISSWTVGNEYDNILGRTYKRVQDSESQIFASRWRSLTYAYTPIPVRDIDNLVSDTITGLSDIALTAGCATSASAAQSRISYRFHRKISVIIVTAENLAKLIWSARAADFKLVVGRPGQMFDRAMMEVDHRQGQVQPAGWSRKVLCAAHLGLMKEVIEESLVPGQRNTSTVSTLVKAKVVLGSSLPYR